MQNIFYTLLNYRFMTIVLNYIFTISIFEKDIQARKTL